MLVIFRELTGRFTCVQVQVYTGVSVDTSDNEKQMWGNIVWITLAESQESTQGQTYQYSGQKLCLDDELLSTLSTKWSFTVLFQNQTLEIAFVSSSQLSCGFYSTWILCLYSAVKEIPFPFTCTSLLACEKNTLYELSTMLQSIRSKSLQTLMCRLRHGLTLSGTQHIYAPRVCHSKWGHFLPVIFVGWQDFGQAANYSVRSQVC